MVLQVQPDEIDGYGDMIGRAANDAGACQSYLASCGQLSGISHGLITKFAWVHGDVLDAVNGVLGHLHNVLDKSSAELHKVAQYYRTIDMESARKIDATYPPTQRPALIDPTR